MWWPDSSNSVGPWLSRDPLLKATVLVSGYKLQERVLRVCSADGGLASTQITVDHRGSLANSSSASFIAALDIYSHTIPTDRHINTYMCKQLPVHTHTHARTHTHKQTQTLGHVHTHTHTHTQYEPTDMSAHASPLGTPTHTVSD